MLLKLRLWHLSFIINNEKEMERGTDASEGDRDGAMRSSVEVVRGVVVGGLGFW